MDKKGKNREVEIDVLQLFRAIGKRIWFVILAGVVLGALMFGYTKLLVTPMYSAQAMLYVNNQRSGNTQSVISQSDLTAAQRLVDTYTVILKTRATLNDVIQKANLPYTYEELSRMVSAASVNNTETFYVRVTGPKPAEAALIANTIAQVLPDKISAVVDGSTVRIVDYAVEPLHPVSPNVIKNVALGVILGVFASSAVIVVKELTDSQIHDPDYLTQTYNLPVLSVIPDLLDNSTGGYGYFREDPRNLHMDKGSHKNVNKGGKTDA